MADFQEIQLCPICGSEGRGLDGALRNYISAMGGVVESRFAFCDSCDFTWMSNPPTLETLKKYYAGNDQFRRDYLTSEEAHHINGQVGFLLERASNTKGSHMEVGPDNGAFLEALRLRSSGEVYFDEWNADAIRRLEIKGIRNIADYPDAKFSTVSMRHVFEHIVNPVQYLASLREKLNDDGIIFIEVPDYSNLGLGQSDQFLFEHVNYFSLRSMQAVASLAGFVIERVSFDRTPFYSTTPNRVMRVLLRPADCSGNTVAEWNGLLQQSDFIGKSIADFVVSRTDKKIAIYGAGTIFHKFMCYADGLENICALFDGDPKKQGSVVMGMAVQSPEKVVDVRFDHIITTVVGYEGEVMQFLLSKGIGREKIMTLDEVQNA